GDAPLAGRPDRQPAEVAHLGHGDVLADLHAELVRVEGERLVLVVDPHVDVGELLEHRRSPCRVSPATLALEGAPVFSKTAVQGILPTRFGRLSVIEVYGSANREAVRPGGGAASPLGRTCTQVDRAPIA